MLSLYDLDSLVQGGLPWDFRVKLEGTFWKGHWPHGQNIRVGFASLLATQIESGLEQQVGRMDKGTLAGLVTFAA